VKHISCQVEGIILKRRNYLETDRIITVFTRQKGKITVIAKGVRKLHSRRSPSLELFNNINLFLIASHNWDIVTETQILNNFTGWKENLVRVGVAYYFCELVDRLTAEEQANIEVYHLLQDSLSRLTNDNLKLLIRYFEETILQQLGYGIPKELALCEGSLVRFIETITERKINSPEIIKSFSVC